MFCAFDGAPQTLRLYGRGRTVLPDAPEWPELRAHFGDHIGVRQIVLADIERVQTSCGYGVPLMELRAQRDTMARWAEKKGPAGLAQYGRGMNRTSIDGLPTALAASIEEPKPANEAPHPL